MRPGEPQTITIDTEPGAGVAYHAIYADGSHSQSPGYPGGNNGGVTDERGEWRDTWVVGPTAAPGRVQVDVVAQGTAPGYRVASFSVADSSGTCS